MEDQSDLNLLTGPPNTVKWMVELKEWIIVDWAKDFKYPWPGKRKEQTKLTNHTNWMSS